MSRILRFNVNGHAVLLRSFELIRKMQLRMILFQVILIVLDHSETPTTLEFSLRVYISEHLLDEMHSVFATKIMIETDTKSIHANAWSFCKWR